MVTVCLSCTPVSMTGSIIIGSGCIIGGSVGTVIGECDGLYWEFIVTSCVSGAFMGTLGGMTAFGLADQYRKNKTI